MRIAICDSDKACRRETRKVCIEYFANQNINIEIFEDSSGEHFLNSHVEIDILLIDIILNGMDGLSVSRLLVNKNKNTKIIYITKDVTYMQKAFGRQVYGFLVKPLKRKELYNIFDHVIEEQNNELIIEIDDKEEPYIKAGAIVYISAEDKYTRLCTVERDFLVLRSMIEWERILAGRNFYRIHRSYIVNFKYIRSIDSAVTLANEVKLNVGRNNKTAFKEAYASYLKRKIVAKNI